MLPRDLAESLTKSDVDDFCLLQPQSFVDGDSYFQHMNRQWNERCRAAQDGIIVESRFSHLLADLAKASISLSYCPQILMVMLGITRQKEFSQLVRCTASFTRNRFPRM